MSFDVFIAAYETKIYIFYINLLTRNPKYS